MKKVYAIVLAFLLASCSSGVTYHFTQKEKEEVAAKLKNVYTGRYRLFFPEYEGNIDIDHDVYNGEVEFDDFSTRLIVFRNIPFGALFQNDPQTEIWVRVAQMSQYRDVICHYTLRRDMGVKEVNLFYEPDPISFSAEVDGVQHHMLIKLSNMSFMMHFDPDDLPQAIYGATLPMAIEEIIMDEKVVVPQTDFPSYDIFFKFDK